MIVRTVILGACMLAAVLLVMAFSRAAGEEDNVNVLLVTATLASFGTPITLYGILN